VFRRELLRAVRRDVDAVALGHGDGARVRLVALVLIRGARTVHGLLAGGQPADAQRGGTATAAGSTVRGTKIRRYDPIVTAPTAAALRCTTGSLCMSARIAAGCDCC
jgi:hypothetical protein